MDDHRDIPNKHINYALHGKLMLCSGILLFIALLTVLCFQNYARLLCSYRGRRHNLRRRAEHLLSISAVISDPTSVVASKGLDPSVIETIPTFIYSHIAKDDQFSPLACAVCLSEFEKDERARVLPNCKHTFHVDCIDMWFFSHSSCPLCRAPIQADIPVNPVKPVDQTAVLVDDQSAGSEHPSQDIEMNISSVTSSYLSPSPSSSSPLKMERCPMKTLELVEVPIGAHNSRTVSKVAGTVIGC
ncbi:hypothetical protein HRI_004588700 [Hibiscus trionum]|uniref:RING-type E3 ubiquitin transferase n=1 Tax=Hibiscus trionum TaxID=183268 RepID=A0A9W7J8D8_HIBTR|nr:hypothetical protein HRI_004588700 [Hibiscus trionum]